VIANGSALEIQSIGSQTPLLTEEIVPYDSTPRWMTAGPSRRRCKRRSRVTYARANSGQAAKRLVAASPGASLPLDASLLSIVANLEGLDLGGLRRQ
jgi:hypothetical protein